VYIAVEVTFLSLYIVNDELSPVWNKIESLSIRLKKSFMSSGFLLSGLGFPFVRMGGAEYEPYDSDDSTQESKGLKDERHFLTPMWHFLTPTPTPLETPTTTHYYYYDPFTFFFPSIPPFLRRSFKRNRF